MSGPDRGPDDGLAVVIPAFRGRYLAETLAALAAQTDRRFRVYVADDGSRDDLAAIVAPFRAQLDLVYRRWPENLGHASLVGHWHRAIALGDEAWVWLFSDDDLVTPDSVAAFWAERARAPGAALYRFQCEWIDAAGQPMGAGEVGAYPPQQSWDEHLAAVFDGRRNFNIVQNIVFSREAFRREGGFGDYPLGVWAEFPAWARFARRGGIRTMTGGRVQFRVHEGSISHGLLWGVGDRVEMIRLAGRMFCELDALYAEEACQAPKWDQLQWFARLFRYGGRPLSATERAAVGRTLAQGWPAWPGLRETVFWWHAVRPLVRQQRWSQWLARWRASGK